MVINKKNKIKTVMILIDLLIHQFVLIDMQGVVCYYSFDQQKKESVIVILTYNFLQILSKPSIASFPANPPFGKWKVTVS
jgi:hypothetical protein